MTKDEKARLIDDLADEGRDCTIREYLEIVAEIEGINAEPINHCAKCRAPISSDKEYCSRACKDQDQIKYNDETRKYVEENILIMNFKTLARKVNSKPEALKRQISKWRSAGYDIGGGLYERIKNQK